MMHMVYILDSEAKRVLDIVPVDYDTKIEWRNAGGICARNAGGIYTIYAPFYTQLTGITQITWSSDLRYLKGKGFK